MGKFNEFTILGYLLGWIEMLDAYQRIQGVDDKQRFVKKRFVTDQAIKLTCPDIDPAEINDFIKQIGEMRPEELLIKLIQKKVDRDVMLKAIQESKYEILSNGSRQFDQ